MDSLEGLEDAGNGVTSTFRALKLGPNEPFLNDETASSGSGNERNHRSPSAEEVSCPALATLFAAVSGDQRIEACRGATAGAHAVESSIMNLGAGLLGPAPTRFVENAEQVPASCFDSLVRGNLGCSDLPSVLSRPMRSYSDAAILSGSHAYNTLGSMTSTGAYGRPVNAQCWKPDNLHLEYSRSFSPIPSVASSLNGNWFPPSASHGFNGTTSSLIDLNSRSYTRQAGYDSGQDYYWPMERGLAPRSNSISGFRHSDVLNTGLPPTIEEDSQYRGRRLSLSAFGFDFSGSGSGGSGSPTATNGKVAEAFSLNDGRNAANFWTQGQVSNQLQPHANGQGSGNFSAFMHRFPLHLQQSSSPNGPVAEAVAVYRTSATAVSQGGFVYSWKGQLPTRNRSNPVYSAKVFLGGIPWDIDEAALLTTFKPFGAIKIEWPGRGGANAGSNRGNGHRQAPVNGDPQLLMGARGRRFSGNWSMTPGEMPMLDPRTNRFISGFSQAGFGYPQQKRSVASPDSGVHYSSNMLPRGSSWSSLGAAGDPGDGSPPGFDSNANPPAKGYVYVIFESDRCVKALLRACSYDFSKNNYYYRLVCRGKSRSKEVQVIPWEVHDVYHCRNDKNQKIPSEKLRTVFVGALHGMLTAEALFTIMNDLFGGVVYAGIDSDRHKYPIGSGRVTFDNEDSFMRAVSAAFVNVESQKFSKKIQVDPYLVDSPCATCETMQGPFFCRELACFKYFCQNCWNMRHASEALSHHKPLVRHSKSTPIPTAKVPRSFHNPPGGDGSGPSSEPIGSCPPYFIR